MTTITKENTRVNDLDDVPVAITVEATKRRLEWVDLVGVRYPVRRPKSIVAGAPKTAIMKLAAFLEQHSDAGQRRAKQRAAKGQRVEPIVLSSDEQREGMESVWRYLEVVLDNPEDYVEIRRRLYGEDLDPEEASAATYLEFTRDPNPDDDIDIDNVIMLVANLIAHWQEAESVRSAVRAPKQHRPQQQAGQVTKRPARRPSGHHKQGQG